MGVFVRLASQANAVFPLVGIDDTVAVGILRLCEQPLENALSMLLVIDPAGALFAIDALDPALRGHLPLVLAVAGHMDDARKEAFRARPIVAVDFLLRTIPLNFLLNQEKVFSPREDVDVFALVAWHTFGRLQ